MKGIEWIKITTNMCEDEKIKLFYSIEGVGDTGFYVWIRFLTQAGKVNDNGLIYLKPNIPYTKQMLAIIFERPLDVIEKVIKALVEFQMIEIYEDGIIKICNWEKHQNIEGMKKVREDTKERVKNFRERKKEKEPLKDEALESGESRKFSEGVKVEDFFESGTAKNESNVENKNCNANVTLQREKREEDNETKKKNLDIKQREEVKKQGQMIMEDFEKINKNIKGLSLKWIKDMLKIHKEEYVRMAIGKALEKNKLDTNYISGILNNWLREGYPKTYEEMEFSDCEGRKSSVSSRPPLRFINFEGRHYDYDDLEKKLLGWK